MPDDWTETPYVRVYLTLLDDQPAVWADDRLLAWWLRLLIQADRYHPASAPVPGGVPDVVLDSLESEDVIDRVGPTRYRFHGLAKLRDRLTTRGAAGGRARAREASRVAGRFAGGSLLVAAGDLNGADDNVAGGFAGGFAGDKSLVAAGGSRDVPPANSTVAGDKSLVAAGDLNGDPSEVAGDVAGDTSLVTSEPATRHDNIGVVTPPNVGVTTPVVDTPSRGRAREGSAPDPDPNPTEPLTPALRAAMVRDHGPDDATCDEPSLHPLHHRWYPGIGWRCLLCERDDSRSFSDRFVKAGGRIPPSGSHF